MCFCVFIFRLFLVTEWSFVSRDFISSSCKCQTFMYTFFFTIFISFCLILCTTNSFLCCCLCSHLSMLQLPICQMGPADLFLVPIPDNLVLLLLLFIILVVCDTYLDTFFLYILLCTDDFLNLNLWFTFVAGNLQGLHNLHGSYNLQGTLSSRNSSMNSIPSPGVQQQPNGSFSSGRFASSNLPVPLSQVLLGLVFCDNISSFFS